MVGSGVNGAVGRGVKDAVGRGVALIDGETEGLADGDPEEALDVGTGVGVAEGASGVLQSVDELVSTHMVF